MGIIVVPLFRNSMPEDADSDAGDEDEAYLDGVDADALTEAEQLTPTPEQHERLKSALHDDELFTELRRAERRYLVIGRGGDTEPGRRRQHVCALLDDRTGAIAVRLEDFGFTSDELELWAPAFDILAAMVSHVVGILEDFDGGYVWELGFLYHQQTTVRDILWLLKRIYESETEMRAKYDNGMAASHLAALEKAAGDRVLTWTDRDDLSAAVAEIP